MAEAAGEIPSIVLSGEVLGLNREGEEWKALSRKVREACETHGCLVVKEYETISMELQQEFFKILKDMFDLPQEKKNLYKKVKLNEGGYMGSNPFSPLYQSFGIYGDREIQAFEKLMWPEGNPAFCEVQKAINSKMLELIKLLLKMIFESYGLGEYYNSKALDDNLSGYLRSQTYRVPEENEEGLALNAHIDKTILSILFQNSVQGLEVESKDGHWINVDFPKGALVVIVGDGLEAWSNGRLHGVKHRVVMNGVKEVRYSSGYFSVPKEGFTIEVPQELVDEEHPLLYRPFVYSDYVEKHMISTRFDALKVYAGI